MLTLLDANKSSIIEKNRRRLEPIIESLILCAKNNLPFRVHRDDGDLTEEHHQNSALAGDQGVFRAILCFRMASGDETLKEHLSTAGKNGTYISKTIQNELIEAMGCYIQRIICERVKKVKFFSLLCDETTDVSTQQQLSICLRYYDEELQAIREDFVTLVHTMSATGAHIRDKIKEFLNNMGLSMQRLRGQGYDGGSNMKGKIKGLQALLQRRATTGVLRPLLRPFIESFRVKSLFHNLRQKYDWDRRISFGISFSLSKTSADSSGFL